MSFAIDITAGLGAFRLEVRIEAAAGVTSLFGRSGAGKSSVLLAVAGLLRPERGRIVVGGATLFDSAAGINLPAHRRRLGFVFQEGRIFPHLSVRQNLDYGLRFASRRDGIADRDRVIDLLDLRDLLARRSAGLSGGERQRVAIGRALLCAPRALLMDEPLASLDAPRRGEILYYIERLRDELRLPVLYVSHAVAEVTRLSDTVVVIEHGRVVANGPVSALAGRLAVGDDDTAAIVEAAVVAQDLDSGLARLAFDGGILLAPGVDALVGERLRVRIPARDVALAIEPPRGVSILNVLPAAITSLAESAEASLDVELALGGTRLVARITRHSARALDLQVGKPVYAMVKAVSIGRDSTGWA